MTNASLQRRALAQRARDALLDLWIPGSLDRTGFLRHARQFAPEDLEVDLAGRVCLVTGATSGLGLAAARALAVRGADVRLLVRSPERARDAFEDIRAASGRAPTIEPVDMADLDSVRDCARRLAESPVDVLIHNAGLLPDQRLLSPQGHEVTFATHVLGPFLLTASLIPNLLRSADARVIWVSSGGAYARRLSLDDIAWERRPYDGVLAYAQTKRAQIVLSAMFARRLHGTRVAVNAMHPGWAATPGVRTSLPRFWKRMAARLRTPEQGADTIVWLAASPAAAGHTGAFWFDRRKRPAHLLPTTRESAAQRRALWDRCCTLTGVQEDRLAAAIQAARDMTTGEAP